MMRLVISLAVLSILNLHALDIDDKLKNPFANLRSQVKFMRIIDDVKELNKEEIDVV